MKVTCSSSNINSFGGINFADRIISNLNIFDTIDQHLGSRDVRSKYKYSDLIRTYLLMIFCGGECAEDISEHLKGEIGQIRDIDLCSADTLLKMQKELATQKEVHISKNGVEHQLNTNLKMNELLVELLIQTDQLRPDHKGYTFDYDNQFIASEKYDTKTSYKKAKGYFPGIASINNHPVYVENRNGNSQVKYKQEETLSRAYSILSKAGITITHSRMDCGSFDKEVVPIVEANSKYFYIRAQRCASLLNKVNAIKEWQDVEIGYKKYQIASIEHAPFGEDKTYRYVISREPKKSDQLDVFTQDNYSYRAIMTNNREMSDLEIIEFYNKRGDSERLFDEMNNDFLWKKMPFSSLNENTVFLVMTAICRNLFHFVKDVVSLKLDFIGTGFRLKKFIFRFIVVPAKWIRQGRQEILKLFTKKRYHLIFE